MEYYHIIMEHEFQNQCPYCGEMIWMEFYPEEGRHQETIIDCEVCCNPILYRVRFDREGAADVSAEKAQ
jgi:predicted RNA-binding Zn-ribbon protein involved in translation (DUF1610 family)